MHYTWFCEKKNQIFALMCFLFSVMCSWLGSYKAKKKILLEMRHQLHQRKFFNFWIRWIFTEISWIYIYFFLIKFFNCQMCIHFCFHFFYVICIQFSGCTDLMSICAVWVILLIYFCVFSKFPLYCFRLLRLCQLFQHLNCRYSYICNVLRYMELFGL